MTNTKRNQSPGKGFKTKTVSDAQRNNCVRIEQEKDQSTDEHTLPAKIKKSSSANKRDFNIFCEQAPLVLYMTSPSMQAPQPLDGLLVEYRMWL